MRIGVGLPTSTPPLGARHRGRELLAWATGAEAGPFSSLGVTDRLVYDCADPMVALAAAAAVTTRLRLVTMVVIGPRRRGGGGGRGAFRRAARHAGGYGHGGGPPRAFGGAAERARSAWADAGRPGAPQLWGQSYFSLADPDAGAAYLRHYYAFTGPFAERVAAGLLDSPKAVREQVAGYAEAGCDELVLLPAT